MARCGSRTLAFSPVGIFGGSFDPPHVGHMDLVHSACSVLNLKMVWVIPAGQPVHRNLSGRADAHTRLGWLQRIFAKEESVTVLDWEVTAARPVPTVDTLRRIRREYPALSPLLLVGEDAFAGISGWIDYPEHLVLCDVAVFPRCGTTATQVAGWQEVDIRQWRSHSGTGRLLRVPAELADVSATGLRDRASKGKSMHGLVPECIRAEVETAYA